MNTATTSSPTEEWASRVSDRRYRKARHELDELVVSAVPAYAASVDEELDRFEQAAIKARTAQDSVYQAQWSINPAVDRLTKVLSAIVIATIAISFGTAFPGGSRIGVSVPLEWRPFLMTMSSAAYAISVIAQLGRWAPYLRHVPPKDGLAWVPIAFGAPVVVWMFWLQQQDIGIPLGAVVLAVVALLVISIASVARLVRRLRDSQLTKKVDAAAKERTKKLRKQVLALADASANRLVERFSALPENDQARLRDEMNRAAAQLANRGLATSPIAGAQRRSPIGRQNRRGMFPGLLLLSHRVKTVNSQTAGAAQWFVGDYVDDPTVDRSRN